MLRSLLVAALLVLPETSPASAQKAGIPGGALRGEAVYRYLGLPVYQARLYTPRGAAVDWSRDFAIELTYLRKIAAKTLVKSTLDELQRTSGRSFPLQAQLSACFQTVAPGDRYLAVSSGPDVIRFQRNGTPACTLRHPQIKRHFMAIFIGENTRSRTFTQRLRGE